MCEVQMKVVQFWLGELWSSFRNLPVLEIFASFLTQICEQK